MITLWILLGVAIWAGCGILAYGLMFAYFQRAYPTLAEDGYREDRNFSTILGFGGPLSLISAALFLRFISRRGGFKHGLKFR